jgi:hypothetical protein
VCFSAKHTALRRKSKEWLARNQDNVSEWDDMSIRDDIKPLPWYIELHIPMVC